MAVPRTPVYSHWLCSPFYAVLAKLKSSKQCCDVNGLAGPPVISILHGDWRLARRSKFDAES
jgi:hypothetical protein